MIRLLRPKYAIPIHGEYRMQVLYHDLAIEECLPRENVIVANIGQVMELTPDGAGFNGTVQSGSVMVDGLTIGEVTQVVLRDRRRLAADGVLICTVVVDRETGELVAGPDLISRGFVDPAMDDIIDQARTRIIRALEKLPRGEADVSSMGHKMREVVSGYVYEQTRRRPMILPVVTEV